MEIERHDLSKMDDIDISILAENIADNIKYEIIVDTRKQCAAKNKKTVTLSQVDFISQQEQQEQEQQADQGEQEKQDEEQQDRVEPDHVEEQQQQQSPAAAALDDIREGVTESELLCLEEEDPLPESCV